MKKVLSLLFFLKLVSSLPSLRGNSLGARIIGGEVARAGQFPFAAAITVATVDGNYFCGGTILTDQWVLTAGQCVDGGHLFTIRLGTTHLQIDDTYTVRVSADTYVLHPDYNALTLDNDLGLIWLRLPVTFSDYLKPVDFLPFAELSDYSSAMAIGWGQTADEEPGIVNDLQWVYVTSVPNNVCQVTYGSQITPNMVCVDGNFNEGACLGDSGGPLVQTISRGHSVIAGIASFVSYNGCESTDPSGYTRLFQYKEWIGNVTGKYD